MLEQVVDKCKVVIEGVVVYTSLEQEVERLKLGLQQVQGSGRVVSMRADMSTWSEKVRRWLIRIS